jgi:hypothetical protein
MRIRKPRTMSWETNGSQQDDVGAQQIRKTHKHHYEYHQDLSPEEARNTAESGTQ